jgi:hypothetical protein
MAEHYLMTSLMRILRHSLQVLLLRVSHHQQRHCRQEEYRFPPPRWSLLQVAKKFQNHLRLMNPISFGLRHLEIFFQSQALSPQAVRTILPFQLASHSLPLLQLLSFHF